jgi:hypothetical protein
MNDYDQILDILNVSQVLEVIVLVAYYSHITELGEAVIHKKTLKISTGRKTTDLSEAE